MNSWALHFSSIFPLPCTMPAPCLHLWRWNSSLPSHWSRCKFGDLRLWRARRRGRLRIFSGRIFWAARRISFGRGANFGGNARGIRRWRSCRVLWRRRLGPTGAGRISLLHRADWLSCPRDRLGLLSTGSSRIGGFPLQTKNKNKKVFRELIRIKYNRSSNLKPPSQTLSTFLRRSHLSEPNLVSTIPTYLPIKDRQLLRPLNISAYKGFPIFIRSTPKNMLGRIDLK